MDGVDSCEEFSRYTDYAIQNGWEPLCHEETADLANSEETGIGPDDYYIYHKNSADTSIHYSLQTSLANGLTMFLRAMPDGIFKVVRVAYPAHEPEVDIFKTISTAEWVKASLRDENENVIYLLLEKPVQHNLPVYHQWASMYHISDACWLSTDGTYVCYGDSDLIAALQKQGLKYWVNNTQGSEKT